MYPVRRLSAPAPAPVIIAPVAALPLYPRLLGRAFADLHESVKAFLFTTGPRNVKGAADLRRGQGRLSRLLGWLLRLPAAGDRLPLRLCLSPRRGGELWQRSMGPSTLATEQRLLSTGLLGERLGAVELRVRATVVGGALALDAAGAAMRLGPLSLPLPGPLCPRMTARLWCGDDGQLRLRVKTSLPLFGLLLEYEARIGAE